MNKHPNNEPPKKDVLLSIDNQWAEAILSGDKRYEYRRRPPALEPPYRVVLYATADTSAIVGQFATFDVIEAPIEELIERTIFHTPHSEDDIRSYFEGKTTGSAIHVAAYREYENSIPLENLTTVDSEFSPPQNFRYLRPAEDEGILELLPSDQEYLYG